MELAKAPKVQTEQSQNQVVEKENVNAAVPETSLVAHSRQCRRG